MGLFKAIPAWVYIVFLVLLYKGIKSCYAKVVSVPHLLVIPAIFLILAVDGFKKTFQLSPHILWFWLGGIIIGSALGFMHVRKRRVRVDKRRKLIEVTGSWTMLILIMAIFVVEFVVHYMQAADQLIAQSTWFVDITWLISGLILGLVIGRNGCYFYKYLQAAHEDL